MRCPCKISLASRQLRALVRSLACASALLRPKGLADALGRLVVPVSNLQAVAWFGSGELRAPHIDARRGDIYGAVYDSQLLLIQDEIVAPYESWSAALPPGAVQITQSEPLARAIAAIASEQFEAGLARDPAEVDANYVRRSDAELMWRESKKPDD